MSDSEAQSAPAGIPMSRAQAPDVKSLTIIVARVGMLTA
jgi:hypothetical protein